jgi:hypothetical protein
LSSILKALKKLEQDADTTSGIPPGIIVKPADHSGIRPAIARSLIIVTALAIIAAVGFIINRRPAIYPRQSIAPAASISPSNETAKPPDLIKKPLPIGIDTKTTKLDDAHKGVEKLPVSPPKSKAYYSEPIHSDIPAPTEIIEINDHTDLKLQAISWSTDANKRMVVINGQICREGESVNEYVVKQINPSDIIVSNGSTSGKISFKIR